MSPQLWDGKRGKPGFDDGKQHQKLDVSLLNLQDLMKPPKSARIEAVEEKIKGLQRLEEKLDEAQVNCREDVLRVCGRELMNIFDDPEGRPDLIIVIFAFQELDSIMNQAIKTNDEMTLRAALARLRGAVGDVVKPPPFLEPMDELIDYKEILVDKVRESILEHMDEFVHENKLFENRGWYRIDLALKVYDDVKKMPWLVGEPDYIAAVREKINVLQKEVEEVNPPIPPP